MAIVTAEAAEPIDRSRWTLTVLLTVALFINYLDRGNLATAAPLIKADLHLTGVQIGLLISAFFWIYVPGQLAGGWLVDRLGGKLALGLGFAVWLIHNRGYSVIGMSRLLGAIYLVTAIAAVIAGWICDRLIASGFSVNAVRKNVSIIGHVGSAVGLLGCAIGGPRLVAVSLFPATAFLAIVAVYPIAQTLAGPRAAGRWVGVQNCVANTAGIVGPIVTGWIVDRTGSFSVAFLLAAAVVLLGVVGWGPIIPRVGEVSWKSGRTG